MSARSARFIGPGLLSAVLMGLTGGCRDATEVPTSADPAAAYAVASQPLSFRQVGTGFDHACGVTLTNDAYCWGLRPAKVPGGLKWLEVRPGETHTCGLTADSLAYCWGQNDWGQIGDGTTGVGGSTPKKVAGGRRWRQVSEGSYYSCGIANTGVTYCWGNNHWGQLGVGNFTGSTLSPVRVAGNFKFRRIGTAFSLTCGATTSNQAYCWGFGWGNAPVLVPGGLSFRQALAGSGFISRTGGDQSPENINNCGVTTGNRLYCWVGKSSPPFSISSAQNWLYVNPGGFHTCALTNTGMAYCLGNNADGQLGNGSTTDASTMTLVTGGHTWRGLSAAVDGFYTCGVTTGNRAFCWGDNSSGQLGDGTRIRRMAPTAVGGP